MIGLPWSTVATDRPFRFGAQLSAPLPGETWAGSARKLEDLGYSSLMMPDHFTDQLAPLTALMAAADATTELRVGSLVLGNDYRHPVVLAKEIATLDVLSGGRVEFGLGAGWMTSDYEQSGLTLDPPARRVDRLEEAIQVIKALFSDAPVYFEGDHYSIAGLDGQPKPVAEGGPPMLVGAGGRRMLGIAAREADIVGINPNLASGAVSADLVRDATAEATDRKLAWVRHDAGERFEQIELSVLVFMVAVTESRVQAAENMGSVFGVPGTEVLGSPLALIGTIDEMHETLQDRRSRWDISYVVVQGDAVEAFAPVVARLTGC